MKIVVSQLLGFARGGTKPNECLGYSAGTLPSKLTHQALRGDGVELESHYVRQGDLELALWTKLARASQPSLCLSLLSVEIADIRLYT